MNYRNVIFVPLLLLLMAPWGLQGQSMGTPGAFAPQLNCSVTISADSLFYVSNDYLPNTLTITVNVTNSGDEPVGNIRANLVKNPRFVIGGDGQNPKSVIPDTLGPNESATAEFILHLAFAPQKNVLDSILVTITSNRGYTTCFDVVWIQREVRANIDCTEIRKLYLNEITFIDSLNKYEPDTAFIQLFYTNIGQDRLHDGVITRILNPGLSSDDSEPFRNVGTIPATLGGDVKFGIVPKNRDNDTTTTVCFQIQGRTGYKDYQTGEIPIWQDTCCIDVFIPKSRQPKYDVECMFDVDTVFYRDHKYDPPLIRYSLRVTNNGTAAGVVPIGRLQIQGGLEPYTDLDGQEKVLTAELGVGESTDWVTWTFRPQPQTEMDSVCIRGVVRDYYGYTGTAYCCIVLDSIRQAMFQVHCASMVDTVVVDTVIGAYVNGTFDVMFTVCNAGTDYADSVMASLSIQSSDLVIVPPVGNLKQIWLENGHTLSTGLRAGEREDTLTSQSCWTFVWPLSAIPRGISGDIAMTFTVEALNAAPQTCEVVVFVPRLDPPDIVQRCYTNPGYDPSDTLHISSETGAYEPERITFCTEIWNEGGGTAKNVVAYFSPPENMILAPGETNAKDVIPDGRSTNDVGPNDTVTVCWEVIPLPRYNNGAWIEFRSDITSTSQVGIAPCVTGVFVPKRPVTAALSISRDNVTYFGAERVFVPVYIDQSDGKDLKSMDLHFMYNVDQDRQPLPYKLLEFLAVAPGEIFPSTWTLATASPLLDPEHYGRVQMAGPTALDGFGLLFYLVFKPVYGAEPYHLDWFVSELPWPPPSEVKELVKINDGLIQPILQPGQVVVSGDCLRPVNATENYIIAQNRPNPFNPTTTIEYRVIEASHVRIEVLDALGRTVRVLVDGTVAEGTHSVVFNADGLNSGMYFYRMVAPGYSKVMKMMISK